MFVLSEAWKSTYPGAAVGILKMRNVANPAQSSALDALKFELERQLRARFAGCGREEMAALETIKTYNTYFKRFKKTYHVLLQLESVALKSKPIPRVAALVESMFLAELKNLLLTAGHDFEALRLPLVLDISNGDEQYVLLNGQEKTLQPGDMMISDTSGVISSVLYGPDYRTRITAETNQVFFTVYAPPGIKKHAVYEHLYDIQANVMLISPEVQVDMLDVYCTE
ncbi:MAG TPA: phenylalanine--tRNA ligase beta subunit-related protein [Anaerolineae bacterium]|jgi:DNA/RNA-binding domain of Phe-tRNA-synthetase-like protein|nr:phenylalanine--tRNA ligase beta subunit-related protein [Anaerolineae bacterium]